MTIIETRPTKTTGDLVAALNEFPSSSPLEFIFKTTNGLTLRGGIDVFAAIHQAMRPDTGAIVEIIVTEI